MSKFKLVCCCISLLIFEKILHAYSSPKFELSSKSYAKTNAIYCINNPDLIANISCKLKAINWERTVANMDLDIVMPLRNISIRFEVFKYTNQFRPFLVNLTVNGCDLMKKRVTNVYVNVAMGIIGKYSNMNHTCPYSGHLAARGFFVDTRYIPFNMPYGKYKFVMSFYEGWPFVYAGAIALTTSFEERRNVQSTTKKPPSDTNRNVND